MCFVNDDIDEGTLARMRMPAPSPIGMSAVPTVASDVPIDADVRALAATAYGEASGKDVFEEIAAIANVLVRQQKSRGHGSISGFIQSDKTFAFAAHDGNARYAKLMAASEAEIAKSPGMSSAVRGARNALSAGGMDYSNGAYFWDGADIQSNYARHAKVRAGIHFTDPAHNIYSILNKDVEGEEWWRDAKGNNTKLRGSWKYKYESTAGWGGTVFWKYNADFLSATGNKAYD